MEVDNANDNLPTDSISPNDNTNWTMNDYTNLNLGYDIINVNPNTQNDDDDNINYILCPMCQTPIKPNAVNLCIQCLNSRYDISEGITKELPLFQCRQCERWYKNPQWISAALESTPLLELLLKKISGINKKQIKLINASFIWTEPHSKRIKLRLTIQKEVQSNAIVEKSFEVTFTISNQQCVECKASFTHHTWKSCIQLRQKVNHKRTFLFLEQLILKHNMGLNCIGIKEERDGIDFFFAHKGAAQTFMSFLHSIIMVQQRQNTRRLISADHKSNVANFKYTLCGELPPICRNDLCLIPLKIQKKCGGNSPLMICYKITTTLHFVDPVSLHTIDLDSKQYFRYYFKPISTIAHLTVFYVMALIPNRSLHRGKWKVAELELVRENDLGDESAEILETVTHLGGLLKEGDMVLGYDLGQLSTHTDLINDKNLRKYARKSKIPDVIVIKKHYPYYSKTMKRKWKLKSMVKERDYNVDKYAKEKEQQDNEIFMRDIEEDFDLRCRINVYKEQSQTHNQNEDENKQECAPEIPDHELLDEFEEMKISKSNENDDQDMLVID